MTLRTETKSDSELKDQEAQISPDTAEAKAIATQTAVAGLDQKSLTSAGQRRVNLIWEVTQATIAICVTISTLWVAGNLSLRNAEAAAFLLLSNAFFLVIGFYFGRTNHQRVGGVGGTDLGR